MDCERIRPWLSAHLDDELDVVRDAEVVAHLDRCPACAEIALAHAHMRGLLQEKLPRYSAPLDLKAAIVEACGATRGVSVNRKLLHFPRLIGRTALWAASFAVILFAGYEWGFTRAQSTAELDTLASLHVRALMTGHSYDVESTDRHTVKPWFAGKLDFSPPVVDLAASGFPLVGGRLERLENQPAAALVYSRRKHMITLFVWPDGRSLPSGQATRNGYNLITWTSAGQHFAAVSDLAADELDDFSHKFAEASAPAKR